MVVAALVVTLREGTEAALVISALAAYLRQIGRRDLSKYLYIGSIAGLVASFALAGVFALSSEMATSFEALFQAGTMFLASAVLTYVLIWMARHARRMRGALQEVEVAISQGQVMTIAIIAFTSVLREGVEAVLLVAAIAAATSALDASTGGLIGLVSAIVIGLSLIRRGCRVPIRTFFKYTSVLLVLIGAMVTAHGIEELQESGAVTLFAEKAYDANLVLPPLLREESVLGSLVHAFIGFHYAPSVLALVVQLAYLLLVGGIIVKTYGFMSKSHLQTIKLSGRLMHGNILPRPSANSSLKPMFGPG